jgi:hypothetical protein
VGAEQEGAVLGAGSSADTQERVVHRIAADGTIAPIARPLFRLAPLHLLTGSPLAGFVVTPDGQRYVFAQSPDTPPPPGPNQIHIVYNWFEELMRLCPMGK